MRILFFIICCVFFTSCTQSTISDLENVESPSKPVKFLSFKQVYYSASFSEPLDPQKHPQFIHPSTSYQVDRMDLPHIDSTSSAINSSDIPIWTYNEDIRNIYSDGTIEYDIQSSIINDSLINVILAVGEPTIDFEAIPTRAVYRNGTMSLYNGSKLLHSAPEYQPDMTEFCDTAAYYYEQYYQSLHTGTKSKDLFYESIIEKEAKKSGLLVNFEKCSDDMVVLRMEKDNETIIKTMSSDFSKEYKTQCYSQGILLYEEINEYSHYEDDKYYSKIKDLKLYNPKKTIIKTLQMSDNEKMSVFVEVKGYLQNVSEVNLDGYIKSKKSNN